MLDRIHNLSNRMQLKLEDKSYMDTLRKHMRKPGKQMENIFGWDLMTVSHQSLDRDWSEKTKANLELVKELLFPHYLQLVYIACTYHLREELVELLTIGEDFPKDIHAKINYGDEDKHFVNRPLIDQPLSTCRNSGSDNTPLGIVSFHGYLDLVQYLVEEKKADVNATSVTLDTPLHNVVKGDSHPENHSCYGTQHAEVAQYLIAHKADITARNRNGKTPLEEAQSAKPPSLPLFFSNAVRKEYFADTVRPILEKAKEDSLLVSEFISEVSKLKKDGKETVPGTLAPTEAAEPASRLSAVV